jgi:hypothetical protein
MLQNELCLHFDPLSVTKIFWARAYYFIEKSLKIGKIAQLNNYA